MKTLVLLSALLVACSSPSKNDDVDAQLKVSGANSQLTAKILVKNNSNREILLKELNSKYFVVQTAKDGKVVEPKSGSAKLAAPLKIAPGGTSEAVFTLQNNYSFWDRLTKYKISYDGPEVKAEPVQVWF